MLADIEKTDYIAEAIIDAFGERCPDFAEGCACCEAWKQYDRLRTKDAVQTLIRTKRALEKLNWSLDRALSTQVEERE